MVPEDLVFWLAPLTDPPVAGANVLCRRHADAMMVPRGWTLDDRREDVLRLFKPRPAEPAESRHASPTRSRRTTPPDERPEQLQIDGTGEIARPVDASADVDEPVADPADAPVAPWEPEFDPDDDLDGLLEVNSPLLARAFRGTDRAKP